jgi:hypothetical protein
MFMLDRFLDLFVGFTTKDGDYEPKIIVVLVHNFSWDFTMELFYSFGPFMFNLNELNSIYYFLFKFPRYNKLFEMDTAVEIFLDYYGKNLNVFELKKAEKRFTLIQFFI